ncbi:UDP-glycosyltransferase 90A1-like [Phoenix dactylifera]|uniref:UDP-glycosyltransferase 90A1-like n=1 Tax=Phoenix dactylifera TaxID=42345 RepID=A0A8B9A8V8_PHODC|nr:UDP-glycosyltransferase 90A1-like [Phoenix dactylifera]
MASISSSALPHVAIFPFMSKGHTIPVIHLAHLFRRRRRRLATLTFFTTPLNAPFIRDSLAGTDASVVELPFPENVPTLPPSIERTDRLPDMSLLMPFIDALRPEPRLLKSHFEQALGNLLPAISLLISGPFLPWTNESALKFGIPRISFYGCANFAILIKTICARGILQTGLDNDRQPFMVPGFPHLRLTKADVGKPFDDPNPQHPMYVFDVEVTKATNESYGMVANSFYELEPAYVDHWNDNIGPKVWCVGPLCLARPKAEPAERRSEWMEWLDSRSAMNRPVVFVAFGSQAEISVPQLKEIAAGLERSGLDFLWVVRAKGVDLGEGLEERVAERGRVVREWADQLEILRHEIESVRGFVSHCGWNSVIEGISAGVPLLAWPMIAEQPTNAKFVADELRIGLRIRASDGTRDGLVRREDVERMVRELMLGEKGKEAAENVKSLAQAARMAMEGGSSWQELKQMIDEVCAIRKAEVYLPQS